MHGDLGEGKEPHVARRKWEAGAAVEENSEKDNGRLNQQQSYPMNATDIMTLIIFRVEDK